MTEPGRVSVVITAYNTERYVAEAVESVLGQTVPPGEIIVIDDGSTDGTAAVLEQFDGRIRYVYQTNQGQAAALNNGVALAQGEFLAFLDSDDYWTPTKLEAQLEAFHADPSLDLVFGNTRQFLSPELPPEVARNLVCDDKLQPSPLISGLLARRSSFERVGPLKIGSISSFVEWYLRMKELGLRHTFIDHHITWRRIHSANTSNRNKDIRREYLQVLKESLDRRRAAGEGAKPLAGSS
jgi:glycosyltransferase involved in cell wall biosynthesis